MNGHSDKTTITNILVEKKLIAGRPVSAGSVAIRSLMMLLSVLLTAALLCPVQKAYAADGSVTVSLPPAQIEYFDNDALFTFRLYKVGSFEGNALVADPSISESGAGIVLPQPITVKDDVYDNSNSSYWQSSWMESASTMADYISVCEASKRPPQAGSDHAIKAGQSFIENGLSDGLYLLVGDPVVTKTGAYRRWTPVPMYIVISTDASRGIADMSDAAVKLSSEPVLEEHRVTKLWSGDADIDQSVRPSKISVGIYYDGELKDTVVLSESNNWTYSWKNSDYGVASDDTSGKWTCIEMYEPKAGTEVSDADAEDFRRLRQNYTFTVTTLKTAAGDEAAAADPGDLGKIEMFRITNTFGRRSLKLIKKTDSYVEHSDSANDNNTIVFEINGYNNKNEAVYHTYASVVLKKTDGNIKETLVSGIPADIVKITAREAYTGSLTPAAGEEAVKEAVFNAATNTFEVTFTNTFGSTTYSGGIVNRYELKSDNSGYKFRGPIL